MSLREPCTLRTRCPHFRLGRVLDVSIRLSAARVRARPGKPFIGRGSEKWLNGRAHRTIAASPLLAIEAGGVMTSTVWKATCAAIVGCATAAIAQTTTPQPQTDASSVNKKVTIVGCLTAAPASTAAATTPTGTTGTPAPTATAGTAGTAGEAAAANASFTLTNAAPEAAEGAAAATTPAENQSAAAAAGQT